MRSITKLNDWHKRNAKYKSVKLYATTHEANDNRRCPIEVPITFIISLRFKELPKLADLQKSAVVFAVSVTQSAFSSTKPWATSLHCCPSFAGVAGPQVFFAASHSNRALQSDTQLSSVFFSQPVSQTLLHFAFSSGSQPTIFLVQQASATASVSHWAAIASEAAKTIGMILGYLFQHSPPVSYKPEEMSANKTWNFIAATNGGHNSPALKFEKNDGTELW